MKVAIIYHSESGNTKKVAQIVATGARINDNIQVVPMSIESIDEAFVSEAKVVILGCPTYCGTLSWQMKKWLDTGKVKLAGKLGSAFATQDFIGGGADIAEWTMLGHMLIKGMVVYTAGGSQGKPYTHYGAVTIKDGDEQLQHRAKLLGKRVVEKAVELFGK